MMRLAPRMRAALAVGLAASLLACVAGIRAVRPLLFTDAEPGWVIPRLLLGLALIATAASAGILAAAAADRWGRTRLACAPLAPLPIRPKTLVALAIVALAAGALVRFTRLSAVPNALWIEDLTLIDPTLALSGRWQDFADAIRPVPFGVARPYGSVGVLYLELFRSVLLCFGSTVFGVRFLSALAGTLSCLTGMALGRALLPRGGGALAGLAIAGLRWSLILSRWGYVAIVLAPIADAATLILLRALRRRSVPLAVASGAVLGIGAHIYLGAWVVLAALGAFALWPSDEPEDGIQLPLIRGEYGREAMPLSRRTLLAFALAAGFALTAAPLFLLRDGRTSPYFARTRDQSLLREIRIARSPLPVVAAAADAIAAPWWLADPSPWHDVPRPRLGWLIGLPVAISLLRALQFPRTRVSAFLLAHAAAAYAAFLASGTVMQPNGFRFAYLTTVTGVAAAAGLLAVLGAVPENVIRPVALAAVGALLCAGALSVRTLFLEWAPRLEVLDGYEGHDNLLARTALGWEKFGGVAVDPRLVHSPAGLEAVKRVRRSDVPGPPAGIRGRVFRVVPAGTRPAPGERIVSRVADERGSPWALVLGSRGGDPDPELPGRE